MIINYWIHDLHPHHLKKKKKKVLDSRSFDHGWHSRDDVSTDKIHITWPTTDDPNHLDMFWISMLFCQGVYPSTFALPLNRQATELLSIKYGPLPDNNGLTTICTVLAISRPWSLIPNMSLKDWKWSSILKLPLTLKSGDLWLFQQYICFVWQHFLYFF